MSNKRKELVAKTPLPSWDELYKNSNGEYDRIETAIAKHCSKLSETEMRVLILVKKKYSSGQIGEILGIREETVEKHRTNSRKKMQLLHEDNLKTFLKTI
ncbi:MAG: LuxR C-terminal-related transcriptional regulator [bacterium]